MMTIATRCVLFLISFTLIIASKTGGVEKIVAAECGAAALCPGGCYSLRGPAHDVVFENGTVPCTQVGKGFYSPDENNSRYLCEPGTYSDINNAEACEHCPSRSYSVEPGSVDCEPLFRATKHKSSGQDKDFQGKVSPQNAERSIRDNDEERMLAHVQQSPQAPSTDVPVALTALAGPPSPYILPTAMPPASEMIYTLTTSPTAGPSSPTPSPPPVTMNEVKTRRFLFNQLAFALVSTAVCVLWLLEWNYFSPLRGKSKSEPPNNESHDVESAIPKSGAKSEDLKNEETPSAKNGAVDENGCEGGAEGDNGYGFFEVIDLND